MKIAEALGLRAISYDASKALFEDVLLAERQRWCSSSLDIQVGTTRQRANLFKVDFVGEERGIPVFRCQPGPWGQTVVLEGDDARAVMARKKSTWQRSRRLSHSDTAFIAAKVLAEGNRGRKVRDLLVLRFPLLIVDELQDTGWHLGRMLLSLLAHPNCRAIVVGDPDQAIYEFNGARPELFRDFEQIEDAEVFRIETTLRCPPCVCGVGEFLATEERTIRSDLARGGRAVLAVCHDDPEESVCRLGQRLLAASPERDRDVRIITRLNSTVLKLGGAVKTDRPALNSRPLSFLHKAVNGLRLRNTRTACAAAEAALSRPLFGTDAPTDEDFEDLGINPRAWRKAVSVP